MDVAAAALHQQQMMIQQQQQFQQIMAQQQQAQQTHQSNDMQRLPIRAYLDQTVVPLLLDGTPILVEKSAWYWSCLVLCLSLLLI